MQAFDVIDICSGFFHIFTFIFAVKVYLIKTK